MAWDALNARWNDWILGYGPEMQDKFMKWLGMSDPTWRKMMLTLVLLVVALVMLISLLMMFRYRPPEKDEAARLYRKFVKKSGLEPRTGETAQLFALRVCDEGRIPDAAVKAVTSAYLDARYGNGGETAQAELRAAVVAIA